MAARVDSQVIELTKADSALVAFERLFSRVNKLMSSERLFPAEGFVADPGSIRTAPRRHVTSSHVLLKATRVGERSATVFAIIRPLAGMKSSMHLEVARLAKSFPAHFADVRFLAGVPSFMEVQSAWSSESFPAYVAFVRLLAGVYSFVSLKAET